MIPSQKAGGALTGADILSFRSIAADSAPEDGPPAFARDRKFAGMGSPAYVSLRDRCVAGPGGGAADGVTMADQNDDSEQPGSRSQQARRERLKQALRDNLKRRKSQIRERGKLPPAPSARHEGALDDGAGDGDA